MLMAEALDQAAGLRRIATPRPVRVITVASGKGGVGKTNVTVNLGLSLTAQGKEVLLLDADLGLANVDVMLGLHTHYDLSHVLKGERTLEEVICTGPQGMRIVPSSSGLQNMAGLSSAEHAGIISAFSELSVTPDVLLIDTAAGISDNVVTFSRAAQEVIVVVCDEPASITDAYALIKLLNREYGIYRIRVLTNRVQSVQDGRALYNKILKVTDRYLDVALDFMGVVPEDEYLRKAVQKQRAVVDAYPRSKSALAFKKLASKADSWPVPASAGGQLEFFVERLIMASQQNTGQ
ncbi:Flagellar synthesis regulator FleN [hydrothermal vent metagenome]|uniref:Flagellar synthesis regulator FleN n=1 Tax=hydrothermal vent metagenome TaxID=652676 RepID=A0A3B1B0W0_9ZZZZ